MPRQASASSEVPLTVHTFPFDILQDKMSGKVRHRVAANAADSATLSVNERILKECHTLYTDPENGRISSYPQFTPLVKLFYLSRTGQWLESTDCLIALHHQKFRIFGLRRPPFKVFLRTDIARLCDISGAINEIIVIFRRYGVFYSLP